MAEPKKGYGFKNLNKLKTPAGYDFEKQNLNLP